MTNIKVLKIMGNDKCKLKKTQPKLKVTLNCS